MDAAILFGFLGEGRWPGGVQRHVGGDNIRHLPDAGVLLRHRPIRRAAGERQDAGPTKAGGGQSSAINGPLTVSLHLTFSPYVEG